MAITDPRAVRYVNECVRPLCEAIRNLKARGDVALLKWATEIAPLVPNDNSLLDDGRTAEGVSILTGEDINAVLGVMMQLNAALDADPSIAAIVNKPCVQPLG